MPATKALFFVLLLGAIVGSVVVAFFPDMRPAIVQGWIDSAGGFTPADSPTDALEKFRECIRKRNYKTAVKYTGGDYKGSLSKAASAATTLAESVDDLLYNVKDVAHLNSPDGQYILELMEPFPKDFEFVVTRPLNDNQYRALSILLPTDFPADQIKVMGDKVATAIISYKLPTPGDPKSGRMNTNSFDSRIFLSLVPGGQKWDGYVALKEEGNEKDKGWKIYFPVVDVESKTDYLKQNYGNYVQALKNVKYAVKRDAASKNDFESELSKCLVEAK
jgi:hypothetical protein